MTNMRGGFIAMIVTGLLVAAAALPTQAASRGTAATRAFDGVWSVSVYTANGPCAPSYRYPARIYDGRVFGDQNDFSYQVAGVVAASGGIAVRISSGGQSAVGYGRLSRMQGGGWWKADGGQCSGTWRAVRRG
jgi:hypothetical protein